MMMMINKGVHQLGASMADINNLSYLDKAVRVQNRPELHTEFQDSTRQLSLTLSQTKQNHTN